MKEKVLVISNFHEVSPISRTDMAYNYFSQRGYDVKVLYSSFSHSLKKQRQLENSQFVSLETISYNSSLSPKRILSYLIFSFKVYRFLGKNYFDTVYINLPPNTIGLAVLLRKKRYSKLIVDILDLWPESFPISNYISKVILYILGIIPKTIRKATIKYCDFCITESNLFYNLLKLKNTNKSKVIHLKKNHKEIPNYSKLSNDISILYLGNIGIIYDFMSLFKIIKGVQNNRKVVLHVIGLGPLSDWFFLNLKNKNINYVYHGATFNEDIKKEIMSKCWFGFNGYKKNTEVALSYKSIDYFSYGLPIINSAKEDLEDLVENEKIGYNFDSESLNPIIDSLSNISRKEVIEIKKRTFQTFQDKFSLETYCSEMDSVMSKI